MLDGILAALALLRGSLPSEPGSLSPAEAAELFRAFSEIAEVAEAGRVLVAHRAIDDQAWEHHGASSPEDWLASGAHLEAAETTALLLASQRLALAPVTARARASGELTAREAVETVRAADLDARGSAGHVDGPEGSDPPTPPNGALDSVADGSARAEGDRARARRMHRARRVCFHRTSQGMGEMLVQGPPDEVAQLRRWLEQRADQRRAGTPTPGEAPERYETLLFDSLVDLTRVGTRRASLLPTAHGTADRGRPRVRILIRADYAALVRGHALDGEVCDVAGIGPVPVTTVCSHMRTATSYLVLTEDDRVVGVGRTAPAGRAVREILRLWESGNRADHPSPEHGDVALRGRHPPPARR